MKEQLKNLKYDLEMLAQEAASRSDPGRIHEVAYDLIHRSTCFNRQTLIRYYYSKFHTYKELRDC